MKENNTSDRKFWIVQIIGWTVITFLNLLLRIFEGLYPLEYLVQILLGVTGIFITAIYRKAIHRLGWKEWPPAKLVIPVILASILVTFVWSLIFAIICYPIMQFNPRTPSFLGLFLGVFFNGSLITLAWSGFYFAYHYFMRFSKAEVEKWKLQASIKEAQLGLLKSQINPHFMFNALNNIRALILEDQEKARGMITHLSDLLRYSLSYTKVEKVSLKSEIEIVKNYFELVSIQYEDKLKYEIILDYDTTDIKIPPMLIQLLVENAIKHGVANLPQGGDVKLRIKRHHNKLHINVSNAGNLSGTSSFEEKLGVGLKNIRERLHLLYEEKASFTIVEKVGRVEAQVFLPIT